MRPSFAGPGQRRDKSGPNLDPGKMAAAAKNAGGYRQTNLAAGPASAHGTGSVLEQQDIGKLAPAASVEKGFRQTNLAAGPASVHGSGSVLEQQDIGKLAPAASVEKGYRQ